MHFPRAAVTYFAQISGGSKESEPDMWQFELIGKVQKAIKEYVLAVIIFMSEALDLGMISLNKN